VRQIADFISIRKPGFTAQRRVSSFHRYVDNFTLNSAGPLVKNTFSANGLYDVDITGVGHQPMGFDQCKLFYTHYVVTSSRIKVRFWSEDNASLYGMLGGIYLSPSSTLSATGFSELCENGDCVFTFFTAAADITRESPSCNHRYVASTYFDVPEPGSVDSLVGSPTSNPSDGAFYHVWVMAADSTGGTDPPAVKVLVEIEYDAIWSEPAEMISS
jgi:hypothetical protein